MNNSFKMFFNVIGESFEKHKILTVMLFILLSFSLYFGISSPEHTMLQPFSAILFLGLIGFLFAKDVWKYTNITKKVYEYLEENNKETIEENSFILKAGLFAKDVFWNSFVLVGIIYLVNVTGYLIPTPITYVLGDVFFVACLIFGSAAQNKLLEFIGNVNEESLRRALEGE